MLSSFAAPFQSTAPLLGFPKHRRWFRRLCSPRPPILHSSSSKSSALLDTLRVLEWDKLCDHVASFAATSLGREATKMKLWPLDVNYEESMHLLRETAAAVEIIKFGIGGMDFTGVDTVMVESAITRALKGSFITGEEAMAVVNIIQSAEKLKINLKASAKNDADWYNRFMPLTQAILDLPVSRAFINSVHQVLDADGSVKDSASSELKHLREQLRVLEKKLYRLMEKLVRIEAKAISFPEMTIMNGRWCLKMVSDQSKKYDGLLLSSGSGSESLVEPLAAVPLNDEFQKTKSLAKKAEEEVLSKLTDKMLTEIDEIRRLMDGIIQLDVVIARAKYSTTFGGTYPDLSLPEDGGALLNSGIPSAVNEFSNGIDQAHLSRSKWKFYARGAYHPLLLQKYHENLQSGRKDVDDSISELGRVRLQGPNMISNDNIDLPVSPLQSRDGTIEEGFPVPVDITISAKTNVVVITGPNTGGKTISLKTVGLAALMAKTGLYVIASEPVQMPWFDAIFADIGDEQSLAQSLSTFSGHLVRIGAIRLNSTKQSLVLLDEVGAGTNPLEGAALGMSILESFAESGALTIATTHHGELKTLKYSNHLFQNACMEFDEVNLQPTYKILWGVPGRSNAINIAERLGLSHSIIETARQLYGTASAEINEIILDMETSKQDFEHYLQKAQQTIIAARQHHGDLLAAKQRINDHLLTLETKKLQAVIDTASLARSSLHRKLKEARDLRSIRIARSKSRVSTSNEQRNKTLATTKTHDEITSLESTQENLCSAECLSDNVTPKKTQKGLPKVGDTVHVSALGGKGTVLKVDPWKGEVMVQVKTMKLKLKFSEIGIQQMQQR